jgi:hypothetical protein
LASAHGHRVTGVTISSRFFAGRRDEMGAAPGGGGDAGAVRMGTHASTQSSTAQRLRESARYPLQPVALLVLGGLALAHLVAWLPLGFLVDLLVWVALYKYAFECMRLAANGRMDAPRPALHPDDSLGWAHIWLQVVFFAPNLIGFLALGPLPGTILALLLALALPAAIMTLTIEENLPSALDPRQWFALVNRIGQPYFLAAGLQFLFNVGAHQAQALALPWLPPAFVLVVFMFVLHVVVLANFHLMGRLINDFHDELDFEPEAHALPVARSDADPDQGLLEQAVAHVRAGRVEVACELLGRRLRMRDESPADLRSSSLRKEAAGEAVHAQYHKLLGQLGRREDLLRHGREWIGILLAQGNDRRVVDVARSCLDLDPAFEPTRPDDVSRVAERALAIGATQVALQLVSMFHRRHPKHRDVPRNSLLAAKLLAERMGKDATARVLLDQVMRDFPDHPMTPEIGAYRRHLGQLAAAART